MEIRAGEVYLMKGNEAIGEAAVRAGCMCYFGYPITPQNELTEYMAKRMRELGRVFLQTESEISTINMVYGAASTGVRVMTSTSSPGASLMMEGISYIAGAELPCVIVNVMRGGPGLGGIQPSQSDYFQFVKGGGHGDYKLIVYAPSNLQELVDYIFKAFDIAEKYRNPVAILTDGLLGQMMETVTFPEFINKNENFSWAVGERKNREPNIITSLQLDPKILEQHNLKLAEKYRLAQEKEIVYDLEYIDDAEIILVAYGSTARICKSAIREARNLGLKVGLLRPISLWPFPSKIINKLAEKTKKFIVVEMSLGQMVEDVELAVKGKAEVNFYGRAGGMVPTPKEILKVIIDLQNKGSEKI
ncbi:MAG: 3-methyl-2-oxobutanoate dehydrogenase subunit VorB [Dictyoglomaceae bacterium]